MDEALYNNTLAALDAVHGAHTSNEVSGLCTGSCAVTLVHILLQSAKGSVDSEMEV